MLTGVEKVIYDSIVRKETLKEQQAEYVRLFKVRAYKKLYKSLVDVELIANGYEDVITDLT